MDSLNELMRIYDTIRIGIIRDEMILRKIKSESTPIEVRNRLMHNLRCKNLRKSNIQHKIAASLRTRLYQAIKRNKNYTHTKKQKTLSYLGCTISDFIFYMEGKFKPGMCWENYGDWHIDHIEPCCSFDLSSEDNISICFHYTNLQPLWKHDNSRKVGSDKSKSIRKRF